ncbi:FMN-dependent NADH-azoreductase [Bacillus sp. FJAT-49711]|uniref:FMN-dependent NADH-azoreductase n=1 Tax=Bacillus sp. FJAT-49711 TaxID=2833585 RepID=UPI001BC8EB47|nr:FMN-dependent NADH-azoreductase [Bacillus sp. FJAT-49711]MBS4220925.1 FMN-dependent NADH-azoreductase [Bacillus sp. FJAT-49711]
MANVLYIKVNPKSDEQSRSSMLANHFIEEYKRHHPEDTVEKLDLYKADIPFLDVDVFSAWGKFAAHEELTETEMIKALRMDELTSQFLEADKLIFATPFWNLSYPPMLKAYIDTICIAGKTFHYTENGPVGLVPEKPLLLIEARGGIYSEGPAAEMENSYRYFKTIMGFMGLKNFTPVIAEGLDIDPNQTESILVEARQKLTNIAVDF